MKQCCGCKQYKRANSFYKKLNRKGLNCYIRYLCKICWHKRGSNYDKIHAKNIRRRKHLYYLKNKEIIIKRTIQYHKENPELYRRSAIKWQKLHKTERNLYQRNRRKTDVNYKLRMNLSNRIKSALKHRSKTLFTMELLGCEIDYFIYYIQEQFDKKMRWNNYGKYWELDHKIPCSAFNLIRLSEQRKCFHYTNLQPLEKHENRIKYNNFIKE